MHTRGLFRSRNEAEFLIEMAFAPGAEQLDITDIVLQALLDQHIEYLRADTSTLVIRRHDQVIDHGMEHSVRYNPPETNQPILVIYSDKIPAVGNCPGKFIRRCMILAVPTCCFE